MSELVMTKQNTVEKLLDFKTKVRNQVLEAVGTGISLAKEWVTPEIINNLFASMDIYYDNKAISVRKGYTPEASEAVSEIFNTVLSEAVVNNLKGMGLSQITLPYLKDLGARYVV